jgi:lipopolysaccharide/colanic/teichoic acid biosynthesis glycosyltransferase
MKFDYFILKRGFDLFVLIVFLPLFLFIVTIVAFLVYLNFGRPIFFKQNRLGKGNKVFMIYKFRSMNDKRDDSGQLLPDQQRLTPFGLLLRKTSMDELPAFINVFKGQMSIVGPRPFLAEYDLLYTQEQRRRHDVLPGITGWAQVNGRNNLNWSDKFELDLFYVKNVSFVLDMKILFLTVFKVVFAKDVAKNNFETTEKFNGNN